LDFHPLAMSIVCTFKNDLLFTLKNEAVISIDGISLVQMPMRGGQQAITFTEMPGPHYRDIVWAHF
jgi:hypothetical protein